MSKAIQISAHYHPLIHFFEASLQTELAYAYQQLGDTERATQHAKRAVFLDHNNQTAIAIAGSNPTTINALLYGASIYTLSGWLGGDARYPPIGETEEMFVEALQAKTLLDEKSWNAAIDTYSKLIEQMEDLHQAYHIEAAKPWLMRAEYFQAKGEKELAENDLRKAKDLDREVEPLVE